MGFNIPLDGSITEQCKARAQVAIERQQAEADKARLDFELVRLIKCGEAMRMGVIFHPDSPYAGICADVVVINTTVATTDNENTVRKSEGTQSTEMGSPTTH